MCKVIYVVGLAAAIAAAPQAVVAAEVEKEATVKVWQVDTSGRPPFKRTLVELPAADVAAMEVPQVGVAEENVETVTVWQRETSGRPPFKRSRVELPVADLASMEASEATPRRSRTDFSGRPPFRRGTH